MTDAAPALPDAELRETLDLLGTVVASVSDRVDNQGNAIDKLTKTAAETRQAAFAAQKQTDPEPLWRNYCWYGGPANTRCTSTTRCNDW